MKKTKYNDSEELVLEEFDNGKKTLTNYLIWMFVIASTLAYVIWNIPKTKADPNIFNTGCFKIIFTEGSSNIELKNAYPISDSQGLLTNAYNFSIENTCSLAASYQVNLESLEGTTLNTSRIKISIDNDAPVLISSLDNANKTINDAFEAKILDAGKLTAGTTKSHSVKLWLDDSNNEDAVSKEQYKGKIVVTTTSNFP